MTYFNLNVLISQIEAVFTKYSKEIPQINVMEFKKHLVLIVGDWEFYLDSRDGGYVFSDVVDTRYGDDITLSKIKSYIVCDLLNNNLISHQ